MPNLDELEKLVVTTDRDGNSIMVPQSALQRKEEYEWHRRPGSPDRNVVDFLTADVGNELVAAEKAPPRAAPRVALERKQPVGRAEQMRPFKYFQDVAAGNTLEPREQSSGAGSAMPDEELLRQISQMQGAMR